jgi:hypothetical protein
MPDARKYLVGFSAMHLLASLCELDLIDSAVMRKCAYEETENQMEENKVTNILIIILYDHVGKKGTDLQTEDIES